MLRLFDQGYVSIYAWDGSAWNQLGASIQGEASGDAFGHSVAISASGDRIVVGATNNEGTGNYEGHAEYLIGMDQLGFSSIKILMEKHLVIYLDMMWLPMILVILSWLVVTETMVQVPMQVM